MTGVHITVTKLRSVRYDQEKGLLEVEHAGGLCQFQGVPVEVYRELMAAESQEHYFDRHIRLKYKHRHILRI